MKGVTRISVANSPGPNWDYPWLAVIHCSEYNNMKRFRSLPDALAWVIKEAAKE